MKQRKDELQVIKCSRCGDSILGEVHWAVDHTLCVGCAVVGSRALDLSLEDLLKWIEPKQTRLPAKCKKFWMAQLTKLRRKKDERKRAESKNAKAHE
jgi:hypothetical protein